MLDGLIGLCPMLGLLGTVYGMIEVFEVLAVLGTGNQELCLRVAKHYTNYGRDDNCSEWTIL